MQRSGGYFLKFSMTYLLSALIACFYRFFSPHLFSFPFSLLFFLYFHYFLLSAFSLIPSPFISNMKFDISGLGWSILYGKMLTSTESFVTRLSLYSL